MKKILSVALSTAMAFSMFASVAFGQAGLTDVNAQYNYLKEKGIFSGYPDEQAHLDRPMTRAQFAKVITLTLGLKEINGVYSFKDKNYNAKHWAAPFVEAVSAAGIMEGKNTTKKLFDLSGAVTVQEMATVLVRALDLEVPTETNNSATAWAKGYVQAAINAGLVDANSNFQANASRELLVKAAYAVDQELSLQVKSYTVSESGKVVEFKMSDDETVKVTLDKALEANKETEVKFTYKDKDFTEKVTYVVTTATKVDKVSATNLKEIDVAFDGSVDETTATDKANYTLSSGSVDSVELLDSKTVRLTVVGNLANQTANKLTVKNVKAGDKVISVTDFAFTPIDNTLPTVEKVVNLGTKAVKVVFSEPVKTAGVGSFKIDGKAFYGSTTQGSREVVLTPYDSNTLTVGEHTLTVAGVEDYFGLKSLSSDNKFTVVEDKVAPTVAKIDATLEKAVVTFSEEVDPSTVSASNVYFKSGDVKKYADSVKKIASDKYEFSFNTNRLPAYEITLFVEGVKDYSANTITETQVKVTAVVDQTRPEVVNVEADSANAKNITVKFSKKVSAADRKYFTVLDKDGKVQPIYQVIPASGDTTGKVFTVVLYNDLAQGTNTIKISGVKDTTTLENSMLDYSAVIGVKDSSAPKVVGTPSVSNATRSIVITFNEVMDLATLANPSNYLIGWSADGTGTGTLRQLPEGTQINPVQGGKAVILYLPEYIGTTKVTFGDSSVSPAIAGTVKSVQVMGVKDASGILLDGYTYSKEVEVKAAALDKYDASNGVNDNAALTAKDTVKVKFDQAIGKASKDDFEIDLGSIVSATADGSNVVTLKLAGDAVGTVDSYTIKVKPNNGLETVNGNRVVTAGSTVTVADQVKPEVKLDTNQQNLKTTGNVIHLPFSESLEKTNQTLYAADLVVTNLRTNKVVTLDKLATSVNSSNDKVLDIAVTVEAGSSDEFSVKVKADANYIKDKSGNEAVESATYATGYDAVVGSIAALADVTITDATGSDNDGKSVVKLPDASATGNKFVYKVSADNKAVATPAVGSDLSSWTAVADGGLIEVANDKNVGIAEVTSAGKAVKFVNVVAKNVDHVAATAAKVTATSAAVTATDMTDKTASIVVKVDGTESGDTFTASLASWDGTGDINALVTAIKAASNGTAALSTVADVAVVEGKIVITSKSNGTESTVAVTITGTDAATAKTLTGFTGTETATGTAAKN